MNERPSHHITARHASIARRNESDFLFSQHQSVIDRQTGGIDRNEMVLQLHIGGRSFQSIRIDFLTPSSLVFFSIPLLHCKYSLCFYGAVEESWQAPRPSERERGEVACTLPYVVVPAWTKLSLSLSWLASCMRASLALGFGWSGWVALFLLTPLFWMRRDMV
jgi:hypothetical protein